MPKQVYKITNFNAGLSTQVDSADIKENQLSFAQGVTSNKSGALILQGNGKTSLGFYKDVTYDSAGGYGLYHFISDYDMLNSSTGDLLTDTVTPMPPGTEAEYLMQRDSRYVDIYQVHDSKWHSSNGLDIASSDYTEGATGDRKPIYFDVNGSIRFTDGGFNTGPDSNSDGFTGRKKLELVNDDYFSECKIYDASEEEFISGPYPKENRGWKSGNDWLLTAPDAGKIVTCVDSTGTFAEGQGASNIVDIVDAIEDGGIGFTIDRDFGGVEDTNLGRSWPVGNYIFGFTYYDRDGQDTEVTADTTGVYHYYNFPTPMLEDSIGTDVVPYLFIKPFSTSATSSSDTYHFDERIKGIRVWVRNHHVVHPPYADTYPETDIDFREVMGDLGEDWHLIMDMDFIKGTKIWNESEWVPFAAGNFTDEDYNNLTGSLWTAGYGRYAWNPANSLTYNEINGHSPEVRFKCRMKTLTVTGNRSYAGNIAFIDNDGQIYSDGIKGDMVIESPLGMYDKFPEDNEITVLTNDGDSIYHIEAYAERLLIFKRNVLHIVNVVSAPFLEEEHKYLGVLNSCQVTKIQGGIYWITEEGIYYYNGSKGGVTNISLNIKDYWSDFFDVSFNPSINYDEENKQLIIVKGSNMTSGAEGHTILYDLVHEAFFTGLSSFNYYVYRTNMVSMLDKKLVHKDTDGSNDYFYHWDNEPHNGMVIIETKNIRFDTPHNRKAVYNIYITSCGCDGLSFYIAADGVGVAGSVTTGWTDIGDLSSTTVSKVDTFKITNPTFKNLDSLQIKIKGTPNVTYKDVFKIDNISISYKVKASA